MVINISLSNKAIYLLVGVFILIIAVGLVYAFGGNQPNIMGHTLSEIQMPSCNNGEALIKTVDGWGCGAVGGGVSLPSCGVDQVVKWSGSGWACGNDLNTNAQTICGNTQYLRGDGTCRSATQIVTDGGGALQNYEISCTGTSASTGTEVVCSSSCSSGFALTAWNCQAGSSSCSIGADGRTGSARRISSVWGTGTCTKI
jgi:hypothetical protein